MAGGSAIRGSRIGSGPMGERERGEMAARQLVPFFCGNGHQTTPAFAVDAELPDTWDCQTCGQPAGRDQAAPPAVSHNTPYKTHLAYVMERRSEADGAALLDEALQRLKTRRGE